MGFRYINGSHHRPYKTVQTSAKDVPNDVDDGVPTQRLICSVEDSCSNVEQDNDNTILKSFSTKSGNEDMELGHNSQTTPVLTLRDSDNSPVSEYTDDDGISEVTDYSEQTMTSVESTGNQASLITFLRSFGLMVARYVLADICLILNEHRNFTSHAKGYDSPSSTSFSSSPKAGSRSTGTEFHSSNSTGKRLRPDQPSGHSDDESGDHPDKRKRVSTKGIPKSSLLGCKLACPFYKRNPERHKTWRSCAGPGWDTIHRLKYVRFFYSEEFKDNDGLRVSIYMNGIDVCREHIYRRHALPIVCARCGKQFDTEITMQKHSKEVIPCKVGNSDEVDGYSKEQEKQLRGRKRPPNQTEEDRWREIYIILFPTDPEMSIPSPCEAESHIPGR
jgi:hypothetical protein